MFKMWRPTSNAIPSQRYPWHILRVMSRGRYVPVYVDRLHRLRFGFTLTEEEDVLVRGALHNARPRQRSQFSPEAAADRSYWIRNKKDRRTRSNTEILQARRHTRDREREQFGWCRALLCLSAVAFDVWCAELCCTGSVSLSPSLPTPWATRLD